MAVVDDAVSKPTFRQRFVRKFRLAFLQLGLPVIVLIVVPILAVIVRDLFWK